MYLLSVQPYLDQHFKCYKNIITINNNPKGPLQHYVYRINPPKLSPFKQNSSCCNESVCILALKSILEPHRLMCVDELSSLLTFLDTNNYEIDTNMTKIMVENQRNV